MKMMTVKLPLEITADILSRLPVDSIVKFKRVCKTWRTLIDNDPLFLVAYNTSSTAAHCQSSNSAEAQPFGFFTLLENQQLNQQLRYGESYKEEEEEAHFKLTKPLNYPPLPRHPYYKEEENLITRWAILGSSNGLICLSACRYYVCEGNSFTYNIYIYNPMTREFVDVGTETHAGGDGFRASGFGYHPSTNKYKVVRINYKTYSSPSGHVSIYTLGSGASGWRDIGEIPYMISGVRKPGVLVNGALYWITLDKKILSFDLADEEFRIVSKPWQINQYNCVRLGVLRGCLSMTDTEYGNGQSTGRTNVWVMINNKLYKSNSSSSTTTTTPADDVKQYSWVKLPVILYRSPLISPRVFSEMSSYGLKYESFCRFNHLKSIVGLFLVPYTKSFVSLKALGEENVKKIG